MFLPVWLIFLGTGLAMAVLTVLWAMRTRQFDDQDRARFLQLKGADSLELVPVARPMGVANRLGMWTLLGLGLISIAATILVVVGNL